MGGETASSYMISMPTTIPPKFNFRANPIDKAAATICYHHHHHHIGGGLQIDLIHTFVESSVFLVRQQFVKRKWGLLLRIDKIREKAMMAVCA